MTGQYLNTREAAAYLGLSRQRLETWRTRGGGPRYVKVDPHPNGAVRYRRADLDAFMESRLVASTSESGEV